MTAISAGGERDGFRPGDVSYRNLRSNTKYYCGKSINAISAFNETAERGVRRRRHRAPPDIGFRCNRIFAGLVKQLSAESKPFEAPAAGDGFRSAPPLHLPQGRADLGPKKGLYPSSR
jgi:hypothetical protein